MILITLLLFLTFSSADLRKLKSQINKPIPLHAVTSEIKPPSQPKQKQIMLQDHPTHQNSSSRVMMSEHTIVSQPFPLNVTLFFTITPFSKIHQQLPKKVFLAIVQIASNTILKLECTYQRQKKIKIQAMYQSLSKQERKIETIELEVYKMNKVNVNFNFDNFILNAGTAKTIVQFYQSKDGFNGMVTSLSIHANQKDKQLILIQNKKPNEWINNVDPISQPVTLKGLVLPNNLQSNKTHSIPILKKGHKLLVCHDMMNGYKQQISQYSNKFSEHAYRFNHWKITDVFVYFSHANIAIPPKHYRIICQRQKQDIDWLKFQMADFLVFLARQYQFDGYLINIEYKVKEPKLFKQWLSYLTQTIHFQLPNSIIVLYDAIVEDGNIAYQSGISVHNIDYFRTVDYFFTDYKWNQQVLNTTVKLTTQLGRSFDVFVGNDVYGRGTFGGGRFNTDVGIKEINKYNLSAAIFAPGYVYEAEGGKLNYPRFEQMDDNLWFGKTFTQKQIKVTQWQAAKEWSVEKQRSIAKINNSTKSYRWTLPIGKQFDYVLFTVFVSQSSKNNNPYTIKFLVLDSKQRIVKQTNQIVEAKYPFLFQEQRFQEQRLTLYLNQTQKQKARYLKIIYSNVRQGLIFKRDSFYLMFYKKQKSISTYYEQRPDTLPYHSFYNVAVGPNYYFNGTRTVSDLAYNFLADYDLPYQNKRLYKEDVFDANYNSLSVNVQYDHEVGWVGAGSVKVHSIDLAFSLRLLKFNQPIKNIKVKLIFKSNKLSVPYIAYKFTNNPNYIDKQTSISDLSQQWHLLTSTVNFTQNKQLEAIYLIHNSKLENQTIINLGSISASIQPSTITYKSIPEFKIIRNENQKQLLSVYVNLHQFPQNTKTIFVKVNNKIIGTLCGAAGFFDRVSEQSNQLELELLAVSVDGEFQSLYKHKRTIKA